LRATFLDGSGLVLGSNAIGHVTAAERNGVTGLWLRSTNGLLPASTRFVEFTLTHQVVTGSNDASADNLSFVLTPRGSLLIDSLRKTAAGWEVAFDATTHFGYLLERSEDLLGWSPVTPLTFFSSPTAVLVDTNGPAGQSFYRVARRQP